MSPLSLLFNKELGNMYHAENTYQIVREMTGALEIGKTVVRRQVTWRAPRKNIFGAAGLNTVA